MNRLLSFALPFFASVTLSLPAFAAGHTPPPAELTRTSYLSWLRGIDSNVSPFTDKMFAWYDEQLRSPLPSQVSSDPDKLYVTVDRALRETIELEQNGDVEEGNTVGFEAFGIVDVPVDVALATKLFHWGRPIGAREGETYPFDTVFGQVHNRLDERWGAGNYYISTDQTRGGIVQELHDDYTILVRGTAQTGYVIFAHWFGPNPSSATLAHTSIVMLKPTANGQTEFRQNVRQNGQSYKVFGLEYGRRNFGFNVSRVRQGEKALANTMRELKNTGRIRENKPN